MYVIHICFTVDYFFNSFITGNTVWCGSKFWPAKYIMYAYSNDKTVLVFISINSEAYASELIETNKEMFLVTSNDDRN